MRYYLYKKEYEKKTKFKNNIFEFTPSFSAFTIKGEKISLKSILVRIMFWVLTFGKYKIFYAVSDENEVMHTSYVVPSCAKFPFMKKGEYEIGPCLTAEKFRRRGLYCDMLSYIVSNPQYENAVFYMVVNSENIPSIKGIEKAGFKRDGIIEKTKIFKRYYAKRS